MPKSEEAFKSTYKALVDTLCDTYDIEDLKTYRTRVEEMNAWELTRSFYNQVWNCADLVKARDEAIFDGSIEIINSLQIPHLWNTGKLSPNSKKYIWLYLESLLQKCKPEDPDDVNKKDIKPPEESLGSLGSTGSTGSTAPNEGIKQIYESLPKGILDKVKAVADKYGEQVESGEKTIEDIRFDEISKELFENMNENDMNSLVGNVGNVLQSLTQGGDMSSLFNSLGDLGDLGNLGNLGNLGDLGNLKNLSN